MKKVMCLFLFFGMLIGLTSCYSNQDQSDSVYDKIAYGFLIYGPAFFDIPHKEVGYQSAGEGYTYYTAVWIFYEGENYEIAKEAMQTNTYHSRTHTYTYQGFTFYENLMYVANQGIIKAGVNTSFPWYFGMFGFNDQTKSIFCCSYNGTKKTYKLPITNDEEFGVFLETYYGEWFDFAAGVPVRPSEPATPPPTTTTGPASTDPEEPEA